MHVAFRVLIASVTIGLTPLAANCQIAPPGAAAPATSQMSPAPAPALYSAAQARDGKQKYEHSCRACHGDNLDDGDFGGAPLRGSYFRKHWGHVAVSALFGFMKSQMPPDDPGGLDDESYADILAYILQVNGYPGGPAPLPLDPAAQHSLSLAQPGP